MKKAQTLLIAILILGLVVASGILIYIFVKPSEPEPIKKCGDGICGDLENWESCASDCEKPVKPVCGDKVCEKKEEGVCLKDCPKVSKCGDNICDAKERDNPSLCPEDCASILPECGNNICETGESCSNCQDDCGECPVNGVEGVYYVSKQGNDNNDGSKEHPWKTIQKAVNSAQAGETVYVKEGTYEEGVIITTSGTADKRITFSNFEEDNVKLIAESCHGFYVEAEYITIKGFNITDAYSKQQGTGNCNDWTASGITTHRNNNIFENNEISDSMYGILLRANIGGGSEEGVIWPTEGSNIVRNNYIHNTEYGAVRVKRSNNNIVKDNKFYYNNQKLSSSNDKEGNILTYLDAPLVFYCLEGLTIENNEFIEPKFGPVILELDMVTRTAAPPSMAPNPEETKCPITLDNVVIKENIGYKTENQEYSTMLTFGRDFALGSGHEIDNNVWYNGNPGSKMIEWGYNFWHDNDKDDGINPKIWTLQEFQENTGFDKNSNDLNPFK